jgi:5-methylcytosine-specific restriction endonuclease McrA
VISTNCAFCGKELQRPQYRIRPRNYCNANHQLKFEYTNKLRDPDQTTRAAHDAVRGHRFPNRDWTFLIERNKSAAMRRKNSDWHKKHNPMKGRFGPLNHNFKGGKIWWRGAEWATLKRAIRRRDNNRCKKCGRTNLENLQLFGGPLQIDHITPYRETKDNRPENLQALCNPCHGKKSGSGQ